MTRYLISVGSVHDAASACDYLAHEVGVDDRLFVVSPVPDGERDVADAVNVLRVRLPATRIESVRADGSPETRLRDAAEDVDADVIALGAHARETTAGESLRDRLLEVTDRSVVVLPGD